MSKKEKSCWVLVEAVSVFRERFVVECPLDHPEYAMDSVVMEEAKVFSSEHVGDNILSHRVIGEAEALQLCDQDNGYARGWEDEVKKDNFFTKESDLK